MTKKENYQRDYHRKWYLKNKKRRMELVVINKKRIQKLIADYKLKIGCMECGYKKHSEALDFDHIKGKKLFNISVAGQKGFSWATIQKEIDKCEVVCANCHRVRTRSRML